MTFLIVHLPRSIAVQVGDVLEEVLIPPIPASKVVRGVFKEQLFPASIARVRDIQAVIGQALEGNIDASHTHPIATEFQPGWMSPEDRQLLTRLESGAIIDGIADVPGLENALLGKANELAFSEAIRYIDELGDRANDATAAAAAATAAVGAKAPIQHRHSASDIDGLTVPSAPTPAYGFFRFNHAAAGEIRRIARDSGDANYQVSGINCDGETFTITEAGIYIATVGGRLSSYQAGAQFNLYVELFGVRAITSVNTYCATIPLKCAVGDTVRFMSYSTAETTLIGSLSLHKIA